MNCYDDDIIWIPYNKSGEIDDQAMRKQVEIYNESDKWDVQMKPKLPYVFQAGGELEIIRSTTIAVTHSSPGCVWFRQEGVLVKFEWPQ